MTKAKESNNFFSLFNFFYIKFIRKLLSNFALSISAPCLILRIYAQATYTAA